jgi:hypothetical protein
VNASILSILVVLTLTACAHTDKKAPVLQTKLESPTMFRPGETIGVKNGNFVVQKKILMSEELRSLQNSVFETEDRVYGTEKLTSLGLFGELKTCKNKLSSAANGGSGHLSWTAPLDRVTDSDEDYKIGLDEWGQIVGLSVEGLQERIDRFRKYKSLLKKRESEYSEKIEMCNAELKLNRHNKSVHQTQAQNSELNP